MLDVIPAVVDEPAVLIFANAVRFKQGKQMRRLLLLLLVVIALARIDAPTALAQKPTPVPTPTEKPAVLPTPTEEPTTQPAPTEKPAVLPTPTDKPTAPPTPVPTKPAVLPTPTDKPTAPPTPVPTKPAVLPTLTHQPTPSPTQGIAAMPAPGVAVMAVLTSSQTIAGRVFDDRNGNGRQDVNEPGVAGVPVVINGQVVAATDAGGRFVVPVIEGAMLSVVPPNDWQWTGDPLPADAPGNVVIPLRKVDAPVDQVAAVTGGVASGLLLTILAGLLFFNGVISFSQATAVRALEKTYRRQKSQELELRMARELAERRKLVYQRLRDDPDAWREAVAQLLSDANCAVVPSHIQVVSAIPCKHFVVAGLDGKLYSFATDPGQLDLRGRVIPIDTSLSYFARVEAQAIWDYLAEKKLSERPVLPRDAEWYLVVAAHPRLAWGGIKWPMIWRRIAQRWLNKSPA